VYHAIRVCQAICRVVNVGVNANGIRHYLTVADGIVLVGVGFACGVIGGGQAIERIVGIADPACDAAHRLHDARAVAGGVQGVGVAGEESAVVGVCQGGQAAGRIAGVGCRANGVVITVRLSTP